MKQAFVAITNPGWFKFNRLKKNKTVIFWKRSTRVSPTMRNGDLFFFLIKGHLPRYIRGYGVICGADVKSLSEIWNIYGTKNGSETIDGLESRIGVNRDDYVGFYIVENVIYLPSNRWATDTEISFAKDIQSGKWYFNQEVDDILSLVGKNREIEAIESNLITKNTKKYEKIKPKKSYVVFKKNNL